MKNLNLIWIFVISSLFVQGQELKTKKIKGDLCTEVFQIEKKSKQKQGTYLEILNSKSDTLICGQYLNDSKHGMWRYFGNKNKPYLHYDYTKDSLIWISEQVIKPDTFPIRIRNNFGFAKLDRPPLYIGFARNIGVLLLNQIKVPVQIMENGEELVCLVSYVVNKEGELVELDTDKITNKQIKEAVIETFKKIDGKWLPGIYAGNPVDTKLYLILDIGPSNRNQDVELLEDKPYVMNVSIRYYGVKTTTVKRIEVGSPGTYNSRNSMTRVREVQRY